MQDGETASGAASAQGDRGSKAVSGLNGYKVSIEPIEEEKADGSSDLQ